MPPVERADAARNRAKILEAAERLFATRDPSGVTMDDIAKAAGVGRGTLYRRYPDRASIARALLDAHEHRIQEQLLRGEGPLGPEPAATPTERLSAFYSAMVDLLERHSHLLLGAETGPARLATGAYGFWRAHVRMLAAAAQAPDPDVLADHLLAPLAPELYRRHRDQGVSPERIEATLHHIAHRMLGGTEKFG
ncbi:helix-turn-helix domain-containing protein [Kitasatospora sp. NPDC001539]|uniref:TetR/AcrR family transcriptional regulator n=1 Tax=Kitasatospora sp. NPDC001539 TaxID=3154384 RepID=UPI00332D9009